MTLKEMKNKIYALLDIETGTDEGGIYAKVESYIPYIIDSAIKKAALYTRCIKKTVRLDFSSENGTMCAALPSDFAAFCYISIGRRRYGREYFEIISDKLRTNAIADNGAELVYIAFPSAVTAETAEQTELELPENVADAVCYGAAMEICTNVYPTDVQRYMRIATEYDERLANLMTAAGEGVSVANGFFSCARGVFF